MMIGVSNHLLSMVLRLHYHSQKVIGSLGPVKSFTTKATPRDTPLEPGPGRHLQRGGRDSTRSTRRDDGPGRGVRSTGDGGGVLPTLDNPPGGEVRMSINGDRIHGL